MRIFTTLSLTSAMVFAAASAAQTPATLPTADKAVKDIYRDEPYVIEHLDTSARYKADGTGELTSHTVIRVQSEQVARETSVLVVPYASATGTAVIDFVRVKKPDGKVIETPITDALEMSSAVSRQAPVYSDLKELHLPVRSLSAGDTLEYQFREVTTKPEAPGRFWGAEHFNVKGGVVLSQTVTLRVPAGTYVQVWSPNHPATPVTHDGMQVWTWTSSQARPSEKDENGRMTTADVKDADTDADGRVLPSVAWTNFHSWQEVGDWYRSLSAPRIEPTAAIRAKADDLTKDAKTPQAQAEALYRFVASQIRYISIGFGIGRLQPHAAAEVLANGYGDCKDKDTLLESLLRAKGFKTEPVLIGAGIAPVPDVPSPAMFNHAITSLQLPGKDGKTERIWLDATAETAPFRVLNPVIRDQESLPVPASGAAVLIKTPADPPFAYREVFTSAMALDDKGVLKGHVDMTVRSDAEAGVRAVARLAPAQWDQAAQYISSSMNFGGKVSNADLRQADADGPAHIAYDYLREDYADWKNNRIFAGFPGLDVTTVDKDKAPDYDIFLGAPRTLEAHSEIALPTGDRMNLPDPVHVKRPYATYDETYRFTDGKFIADRVVVVKQRKLPKAEWKDYVAFQKEIGALDELKYAGIIPPAKTSAPPADAAKVNTKSKGEKTAADWMEEATAALRRLDYEGEKAALIEVEKVDPNLAYLWSMRGARAMSEGRPDEAIANYQRELRAHPDDDTNIIRLLARALAGQKRYREGIEELQKYQGRDELPLTTLLASMQAVSGDRKASIATLRAALEKHPADRDLRGELATGLRLDGQTEEAVDEYRKALDGDTDASRLNNNSYLLSLTKRDLPAAEKYSRKSIEILEMSSKSRTVSEANTKAFADSMMLNAAWDTLGYILLLQGKVKDSVPYFEAAFFTMQTTTVGNHLAESYEAIGDPQKALDAYEQSLATGDAAKVNLETATKAAERLRKDGVKSLSPDAKTRLQNLRTYHFVRPAGISGGGIFRVQLSKDGVAGAELESGDAALRGVTEAVIAIRIAGAVPPASDARVLRDASVYCGKSSPNCDFVLMTRTGLAAEAEPK